MALGQIVLYGDDGLGGGAKKIYVRMDGIVMVDGWEGGGDCKGGRWGRETHTI